MEIEINVKAHWAVNACRPMACHDLNAFRSGGKLLPTSLPPPPPTRSGQPLAWVSSWVGRLLIPHWHAKVLTAARRLTSGPQIPPSAAPAVRQRPPSIHHRPAKIPSLPPLCSYRSIRRPSNLEDTSSLRNLFKFSWILKNLKYCINLSHYLKLNEILTMIQNFFKKLYLQLSWTLKNENIA